MKYEFIKLTNSYNAVNELIIKSFVDHGKRLSLKKACNLVEEYLEELAEQATKEIKSKEKAKRRKR